MLPYRYRPVSPQGDLYVSMDFDFWITDLGRALLGIRRWMGRMGIGHASCCGDYATRDRLAPD